MPFLRFDPETRSLIFTEGRIDDVTAHEMDKIAAWAKRWANRIVAQDREAHPSCTRGGRVWRFGHEGDVMVATYRVMGREGVEVDCHDPWPIRRMTPRKPYVCAACSRERTGIAWTPTRVPETDPVYRRRHATRSTAPWGHQRDRYCDACVQRGGYFKIHLVSG